MIETSDGINVLSGNSKLLIIAPHGPLIDGEYQNDVRTGIIAEELHRTLGCSAIINTRYFKPKGPVKKDASKYFLDLYRVDHSIKVKGYIETIRSVIEQPGKTLVLWIHGIFDHFAISRGQEHIELGLFDKEPEELHALVAYGQGGDPKTGDTKDRFTAHPGTLHKFILKLNQEGMNTIPTHPNCNNYRGRDAKRFNQYFLNQGYTLDQVESIQLEIKESGFRNSRENAVKTAGKIYQAIVYSF